MAPSGGEHAEKGAPIALAKTQRQAVAHQKLVDGTKTEEHRRMPIKSIEAPSPTRQGLVLADRQCVDIAIAAARQVASAGVMPIMIAFPPQIGGQGDHPQTSPHPVAGPALAEERLMSAIVLNDEGPDQEETGRQGQSHAGPVADEMIQQQHSGETGAEQGQGEKQLQQASPDQRRSIRTQQPVPFLEAGRRLGHSVFLHHPFGLPIGRGATSRAPTPC